MRPRIKKGDNVIVLTGKDKGKKSKVIKVLAKVGMAMVEKINVAKRHQKPTRNFPGGIVDKIKPMSLSKLMIVCPHCGKPTRIAKKGDLRMCKKCKQTLDKGK